MSAGLLRAEWIKLWSVRSTYLTLGLAALMAIGLGALDTSSVAHNWATMSAADRAGFDAVSEAFNGGQLGQLAFGVLGVLVISSEYATGLITSTLTAAPDRAAVFAAKALVTATVTFVIGEVLYLATSRTELDESTACRRRVRKHTARTATTAPGQDHVLEGSYTLDGAGPIVVATLARLV